MILLELVFDILDEELVSLEMKFILEGFLFLVVDDGDQHFIDKPQVVEAH